MSPAGRRRILHAASGGVGVIAPIWSYAGLRIVLAGAAFLAVLVEIVRLSSPRVARFLGKAVPVYRDPERHRPSGAMWLALGYALAAWTPPPAPLGGILVAACADPAASLVGSWRTASPSGSKTWRGSMAHWLVAASLLLVVGVAVPTALAGALVATLVERWPLGLNDNLVVPPATALTIAVMI